MQLTLKGFEAPVFEPAGDYFLGESLRIMDLEGFSIGEPRDKFGLFWPRFDCFQHFVQAPGKRGHISIARSRDYTNRAFRKSSRVAGGG
jgi:hypothetical protein